MRIGAKFNWGAIEVGVKMHPNPPADFKSGKVAALNFLKGQVMKLSKGKANPALVGRF
jgi:aspartyl-tRNA(Asn)/glutamyl-tRNA(Gln) amidotransferase subunit B